MKKNSIGKNYIYNLLYQIIIIIVPIITTPYVSRVLGVSTVGEYSYANSIVSYFMIVAILGSTTYGQREISYFHNESRERSIRFWEICILRTITTIIAVIAYFCYIYISYDSESILYLILTIELIAIPLDISWFFQGMEQFGAIIGRNIIFRIVQVVYTFVFIKKPSDLVLYVLGICAIRLISNISLWPILKKDITKVSIYTLRPFRNMKDIVGLFIPTVAIQVYTVLDKTMIGIITHSSVENGYYEQAEKISKLVLTIVTSLSTVMVPRIGSLYAENKKEEISNYIYKSYNFIWMLGIPLCFGLIGIAHNFVPWFFGPGYDGVIPVLIILSFLILAIGDNNAMAFSYLVPTKQQKVFTKAVTIGAVINFCGNLIFINIFSAVGAAIASLIAETSICVFQHYAVRKEISISHITKLSVKYLIAGIVMLGIIVLEGYFLESSILNTFIMVCSGVLIYFTLLVLMKDKMFVEIIDKVLRKFHFKK